MDDMTRKLHKDFFSVISVLTKFHILCFIAITHVTFQCCSLEMLGGTGDLSSFPAWHLNIVRHLFKNFLVSKCSKLFISVCMCNYIDSFVGYADILENNIYFSCFVFFFVLIAFFPYCFILKEIINASLINCSKCDCSWIALKSWLFTTYFH